MYFDFDNQIGIVIPETIDLLFLLNDIICIIMYLM